MLIPLLAVHITHELVLGAGLAGIVLAVRQFVQQGLGLFAGPIADWIGYREMMLAGLFIRALGFAWLAVATEPFGLMMAGVVAALGGAGFEASGKAGLAAVSKGYRRETIFSLSATVGNVGMALGPVVGALLIRVSFTIVGLIAAAIYIFAFFLLWLFVPKIKQIHDEGHHRPTPADIFGKLGEVWKNRPFVLLSGLLIGYYFLYVQINITLPLMAVKLTGSEDSVVPLYLINSGLAIFLQYLSVKLLGKWFQPVTIIIIGMTLTTLGLASIIFAQNFATLIVCVVVFSIGRLFVEPVAFGITARYATDSTMASYFGFSSLALAFGGMFGNSLGGYLFDTGNSSGFPALCWLVFGVVGGLVVVGLIIFHLKENHSTNQSRSRIAPVVAATSPNEE
jgi:DHA1 family multidrug resistance protein-like MFS transporter